MGRHVKKFFRKLRREITRPFTRSSVKKLDNSLRESLDECNNQEQQALVQLRQQQALEHAAIATQRNIAQQNIQNESNRFLSYKTECLADQTAREEAFKKIRDKIIADYTLVKAALVASASGKVAIVRALLDRGPILKRLFMNLNPLHIAAERNQLDVIRLLAQRGIGLNRRDRQGETALQLAQFRGKREAAQLLKRLMLASKNLRRLVKTESLKHIDELLENRENPADINATNKQGYNALQIALIHKRAPDIINFLLKLGADCEQNQNPREQNALEIAKAEKLWEAAEHIVDEIEMQQGIDFQSSLKLMDVAVQSSLPDYWSENAWAAPERFSIMTTKTLRASDGKETLFLLARAKAGIVLYTYVAENDKWESMEKGPAWSDDSEWASYSSYVTIRTQVLRGKDNQDRLYLLGRSRNGIELHVFDPLTRRWAKRADGPEWSDKAGWAALPYYYTITTEAIRTNGDKNKLLLIARWKTGIVMHFYDPETEKWEAILNGPAWKDEAGWGAQPYFSTIKARVIATEEGKDKLLLMARWKTGIVLHIYDPISGKWQEITGGPCWADGTIWSGVDYYSMIRADVVRTLDGKNKLSLLSRSNQGIELHLFCPTTQQWQKMAEGPAWSDAIGWLAHKYYSTIRTQVIRTADGSDKLFVIGGVGSQIQVRVFDPSRQCWEAPTLPNSAVFQGVNGWLNLAYSLTLRTVAIRAANNQHKLLLLARTNTGIQAQTLDLATRQWTVATPGPQWADQSEWSHPSSYSMVRMETVHTPENAEKILILGRSKTGIKMHLVDPVTGSCEMMKEGPALTDAAWGPVSYYSTLRTHVICTANNQEKLFLIGRAQKGVVLYECDLRTQIWKEISGGPVWADSCGFSLPQYYSTFRAGVIRNSGGQAQLYCLIRTGCAIDLYFFDPLTGVWSRKPCGPAWADGAGCGLPQYYSTIRNAVIKTDDGKEKLLLLMRGGAGILLYVFDPETAVWRQLKQGPLWSDGCGMGEPEFYSTIKMVVFRATNGQQQLALVGRSGGGMHLHVYDLVRNTWEERQMGPRWQYGSEWSKAEHYDSIRFQVLPMEKGGDKLLLSGCSKTGIEQHCYDFSSNQWAPLSLAATWTDADRARNLKNYTTLQTKIVQVQNRAWVVYLGAWQAGGCLKISRLNPKILEAAFEAALHRGAKNRLEAEENQQGTTLLNTLTEAQRQLFVHAANGDLAKINEDFEQLADINQVDKEGNSALQIALINHQPVAVIQRLIDAGPELNYQNPRGKRAIDLVENSNIEQRSLLNTGECLRGIDWSLARDKVITAYAEHKSRVTRFLESKRDVQERCCAMMKYYQWVSRNDAYALYVWPGILLLNELASVFAFCPEEHLADPDVQALIEANEAQFKHTVVLYRTLFQWGLEAYPVLQAAASVNDEDWLFVKNGFLLKRRGFEAASSLSVRDIQEACVLDQVYKEAEAVALLETGIEHFYLNFLNRMAQTPHVEEIRKLATRIGKEQRTVESRLLNRVKMNNTVDSVCEEPEDIIEQGQSSRFIVLPEPAALPIAMKCANQQLSQVTLHFQQQGEALAEERRQLVQALAEEEIRVNQYINQLQQFIVASIQADVKLDLGISQAQAVIQREFDQVRAGLRQNYQDSRAKLEQKTFVGLVGMAVASFTGGALAPLIASSLVGATSGALAITTVMVEGAITAGINGAIAGKNPLTAAIQGAAFAGLSCHLAEGPLSNLSKLRQGAIISMTISGLSTLVNGGDPFKNMLAAGVASVLSEIAIPTKPGRNLTTRENAVRSTVTGITTAAMDGHGNLAEKVLNATVGACITTIGQNAGAQVSSVILNAHSESTASRVMMRDMNTSIGASEERKIVQEAGELSVAQNASAHETERPVKKSVNKTDDSVVYSQPELLEVATKEASRLLEKEGIHVSDANIKSIFEKRPALQGSPQSIESKLIKLGRAENGPKDASTAFDKGVEKVLAVTVNTLMSLVGIGEVHAANRDLLNERGLQIYNPELERKVFLTRGLTGELWKKGGVHTASNLESSASGKTLLFRGSNRTSKSPFNPKQSTAQSGRARDALYNKEIIIKISTDSLSGHVYMHAPIADETGKTITTNIGFYPAERGIKAMVWIVPAKVVIEPGDTSKGTKHLATQTLRITERQYLQLAENLAQAIKNPGFYYNLFGIGGNNCLSFIDLQLKAIGIVDGLSNKFEINKYEQTSFAPIKVQANWLFDGYKEQRMLVACGSEDMDMYHQYKGQLARQRTLVIEANHRQATQHFVGVPGAQ